MSFEPTRPNKLALLPPKVDFNDVDLLKNLILARSSLAELSGLTRNISTGPNPLFLMSPAIIRESVASSQIEAINTTVIEVMQGQLFPESEQRSPDKEVLRYQNAMMWAVENLPKLALSTRLIRGIHKNLMLDGHAGEYRRQQNEIRNTAINKIVYIPPVCTDIDNLIANWEKFVNSSDNIDPLLKCAIAHYQFEAIHPFLDGNGRTGRILMIVDLLNKEILSMPTLYISGYLNENREEYYKRLNEVSSAQAWKPFLLFMLKAFTIQAIETKSTFLKMMDEYESFKATVKKKLSKIYSGDLVDFLFGNPVTTPVRLGEGLNIHYTTASKYLIALNKIGLLKDKKIGKNHFYYNSKLLKLLER